MARLPDIIIAEQFAQSSVAYARQIAALEAEIERLRTALKAAQTTTEASPAPPPEGPKK